MKRAKPIIGILASIMILSMLSVAAYAEGNLLERGQKGDKVKELQGRLMERGYFNYDTVTGYFGKITEDAVRTFQQDNGLKVDGIVGSATWSALFPEDSAPSPSAQPTDSSDQVLSRNMEGERVREIQIRLQELGLYTYDRITGYFGSITENAVISFQKAYGLLADGIVGPETYSYLFSEYKETSLIPGMTNGSVSELQQRLKDLGYYTYDVDGAYGSKTREAIMYFQRAHNLAEDGIAGMATKQVLFSSAAMTEQEARRMLATSYQDIPVNTSAPDYTAEVLSTAQQLVDYAKQFLGAPYVYAADGPDSFDCTGFTCYVFSHFGINLPRSAYDQGYGDYGVKITDPSQLQPGDLIFFDTIDDGDLSDHAGIYIGNGEFIHANSGSAMQVTITNMFDSQYYTSRFSWGRKVLN